MHTLIIKDLVVTAELDSKAMAAVRGGMSKSWSMGKDSYQPYEPSYGKYGDFSFDAKQSLGQDQQTLVNNGNNVAFANNITATVEPHQTGTNTINFG
jgi:hypothetical protein